MILIDRVHEILDEIAEQCIPKEFYKELNGGILLLESEKISPAAIADDLYILGEYVYSATMGRYINIYYGSLMRAYGHLNETELQKELKSVLIHEFTHHLESLSGERGLEIEDEIQLRDYLKRQKTK